MKRSIFNLALAAQTNAVKVSTVYFIFTYVNRMLHMTTDHYVHAVFVWASKRRSDFASTSQRANSSLFLEW